MRSPYDRPVHRRQFLRVAGGTLAAAALSSGCLSPLGRGSPARARSDVRITRISAFEVKSKRWKHIGKNARRGDHGRFASDGLLRIETDAGLEGIGSCYAPQKEAARLIGADPLSFYRPGMGIESPLGRGDGPLWDLVGRVLEKPVWELMGAGGPEWVEVYDGSIYFGDLRPGNSGREIDQLLREVEHGLEKGHRAFKIKVGRGNRWMQREAGRVRDVQVVRAIRRAVGPQVKLMVDANNGYAPGSARRFLEEAGDDFYFAEEMFPESVEGDLAFKEWLRARGWKTLVADGESARQVDQFVPYIKARALDVLQGDIRAFGFTRLLELARLAEPTGIRLAPHNWGSVLGLYMQLALGRAVPNFLMAEQDPAETELFDTSGFELEEGRMRVPDSPGSGLTLRHQVLERIARPKWVVG